MECTKEINCEMLNRPEFLVILIPHCTLDLEYDEATVMPAGGSATALAAVEHLASRTLRRAPFLTRNRFHRWRWRHLAARAYRATDATRD